MNDIEASPPLPPVPPETPPEGTPARRRPRIEWIIGIGIVVLIAVVLVVLLRPRDRLPSELAGQPILHGALLDGLEEGMESFEYEGFSLDVAFYGRFALQPDYMVLVTNGPAPLDPTPGGSLFDELPTGVMSQDNAELDFSRAVRRTRDGVEFVCVPGERTDVGVPVSICFFQEDFAGMVIATNGTDPADLLDITMKLHEELG